MTEYNDGSVAIERQKNTGKQRWKDCHSLQVWEIRTYVGVEGGIPWGCGGHCLPLDTIDLIRTSVHHNMEAA